jgi:hypothetical protein
MYIYMYVIHYMYIYINICIYLFIYIFNCLFVYWLIYLFNICIISIVYNICMNHHEVTELVCWQIVVPGTFKWRTSSYIMWIIIKLCTAARLRSSVTLLLGWEQTPQIGGNWVDIKACQDHSPETIAIICRKMSNPAGIAENIYQVLSCIIRFSMDFSILLSRRRVDFPPLFGASPTSRVRRWTATMGAEPQDVLGATESINF